VNGDGKVDMGDVVTVLKAMFSTPSSPNWNPACDLEQNGKIDMGDVVIVLSNFGETV
jgi:Ca2+-binding EF-hand superfamily protein